MVQCIDAELSKELGALARIRRVQSAHINRAVAMAARLADEAAEMTAEGIKDIFDEDSESDAAVQAALVRQTSDRAMHAVRRVNELKAAGQALAFGHTTDETGQLNYVGRLTVIDDDEALLVDWRAPAAVPFYQATPLKRMGVERRRNFLYGDGANEPADELVSFSDELFDPDAAADEIGLRGEAALMASVSAPTRDQMRSVVATIQAEQDAIIRAAGDEPLVVQGGPGTGKTVVALHRAAYLLYAQREALSDTGVLIVGPSTEFLNYIAGVLPSLGETGVVSITAPELYPGASRGKPEPEEVSEVKGRLDMATLLANAVSDRQRRPKTVLNAWYGARRVTVPLDVLASLFDRAKQYSTHNEGADFFRFELIETLTQQVFDPSFHNRDDARDHFRRSEIVAEFLLGHWPSLTPEQALNDLFGSKALLRLAARATELSPHDLRLLYQPRSSFGAVANVRWSNADIALLDELLAVVGIASGAKEDNERTKERDESDEFEMAAEKDQESSDALAEFFDDDELDDPLFIDELQTSGEMFDASILDQRFEVQE